MTHGDDDHAGGLDGLVGTMRIDRIWLPDQPDPGPALVDVIDEARRHGIPVVGQRAGPEVSLGRFSISLLGPRRRYASPNDGSIVLWVETTSASLLLAGDIEAVAQSELPELRPDVLLVPHHGSATTDLDWLEATVGLAAVLSVGENTYGHPTPGVLRVLREAGAHVWITEDVGDVILPLG